MTIRLLTSLLVAFALPLGAQEVLTPAYFPQPGDTLQTNTADLDWARTLDLQPEGGAELTWDFPDPTAVSRSIVPVSEANSPYFPTADFVTTRNVFTRNYYRIDGNAMNLIGVESRLDFLPTLEIRTPADPPRATRRAGLTYGEDFINNTTNQLVIPVDSIPPEALALIDASILSAVDSLRISTITKRNDDVDAYGTLHLGNETFSVIRERREESVYIQLEVRTGIFPWIDITNSLNLLDPDIAGAVGQQDTVITYIWWNNNSKEAIAQATLDLENELLGLEYKNTQQFTSTHGPRVDRAIVKIYPNPATSYTNFAVSGLSNGRYQLSVVNTVGQRMMEQEFNAVSGQNIIRLDVGAFPSGVYLVSLRNERGRIYTTRRVFVR